MDLVYPLGSGSKHDDMELFYSIQSALKYVPHDNIWIFGDEPKCIDALPPWVHCVANQPNGRNKEDNIRQNLEAACRDPRVSDNFIMVNDDHFFCGAAPDKIKYYTDGMLPGELKKKENQKGWYKKAIQNTIDRLEQQVLPIYHYDVHCPMVINKSEFLYCMGKAGWTKPGGYLIKSIYGNHVAKFESRAFMNDMKFRGEHNRNQILNNLTLRWVFSLDDAALNDDMWEVLKNL